MSAPTAWAHVPFGEAVEDATGGHRKTQRSDYLDAGEYPIVDQGQQFIGGYTNDESALSHVDLPVVVFGDHTRCVKYVDFRFGAGADGVKVLRARKGVDPKFLYYFLRSIPLHDGGYSRHFKYLKEVMVPLPPIEEQRRIAAVLDAADALQANRRRAVAKLDTLTQAIFIEMFGDPRRTSDRSVERLGDHVELYSGSTLPAGVEFVGQADGFALVKVSDLARHANDKYILSTREWTAHRGQAAATCPPGSIVIPKRGGAISTNRKRISTRSSILDPNLMGIAPRLESLRLEYLFGWFELLDLESIQNGSSIPQLNKKDLAPLRICVPSIAEQMRFGVLVGNLEKSRSSMVTSLSRLETLNSALRLKAFRGDL